MEGRTLFDSLGTVALVHHEELAAESGELGDGITREDWEEMMLLDEAEEQERDWEETLRLEAEEEDE